MIQYFINDGVYVDETLEGRASAFRAAKERIVPLFIQKRVVASACA